MQQKMLRSAESPDSKQPIDARKRLLLQETNGWLTVLTVTISARHSSGRTMSSAPTFWSICSILVAPISEAVINGLTEVSEAAPTEDTARQAECPHRNIWGRAIYCVRVCECGIAGFPFRCPALGRRRAGATDYCQRSTYTTDIAQGWSCGKHHQQRYIGVFPTSTVEL